MGSNNGIAARAVPPLQQGDRLTVTEFERRYEAMPYLKKAELIFGMVYMPSPVRFDAHAQQQFDLITWAGTYRTHTTGVQGGDNCTLRLQLGDNEPQPDACLRIDPKQGGQSQTSADGYIVGAPEWVGEVAASSVSYDLHSKLDAYQLNGVQEYLVWRVDDHAIDWFQRRSGKFRVLKPTLDVFKSKVFPGLWLNVPAMLERDMVAVLKTLEQGLRSEEHARFMARLSKRRSV